MGNSLNKEVTRYAKLRASWSSDINKYAKDRFGITPTWQQQEILKAIVEPGAKVSCRSGHGVGKTAALAMIVWWFLETRNYPKIPCTAPTSAQLRDVLWSELAKWARKGDDYWSQLGVNKLFSLISLFSITRDKVYDVNAKEEWYAVARTSGKDNPDALQGFHASSAVVSEDGKGLSTVGDPEGNILFVIDEASGVYEPVFEVAEGALSSHGARLLMMGNPTKNSGYFAHSHKKDRAQFRTLHFKSSDSPLVTPEYRDRLVRKYGEGSNIVRVRADGEFPKVEDDVLIPLELAESAINREPANQSNVEIKLGIDVARFGDDRTTFIARQGSNLIYAEVATKKSTMWTAGRGIALAKKLGATKVYIDVIGVGGGVADRMREVNTPNIKIIEVNVSKSAPTHLGVEIEPYLLRDYVWVRMFLWLRDQSPSFALIDSEIAEDLAGELSTARYGFHSSGKLKMASKDQQKKELGFSPDIADALGVTMDDATNSEIFIGY